MENEQGRTSCRKRRTSLDDVCIRAIARITASVTHDVKNCLAVIKESSGLLEDFATLLAAEDDAGGAASGAGGAGGVPAVRVSTSCGAISLYVDRAAGLLKALNTFVHSGDHPESSFILRDVLAVMLVLTGRHAAAREVTVFSSCEGEETLVTQGLVFHVLLFHLLMAAFAAAGERGAVHISLSCEKKNGVIHFADQPGRLWPSSPQVDPDAVVLAAALNMEVYGDPEGLQLLLQF